MYALYAPMKNYLVNMLLLETLWTHLAEVDEECNEMIDRLVKWMVEREVVTEQLKSDDWLCWLQKINSIRNRAEEVVLHDLVYVIKSDLPIDIRRMYVIISLR